MQSSQEAVMTNTIRTARPHLTLNSDGQRHPLLNVATFFTFFVGLISFALGLLLRTGPNSMHAWAVTASVTGLVALLVGLISQMMSATREERVIIVTGMIAGFIGLALGLAHGGLS
jgi:uncharacterized membrane protein HdeD (DUF308 family)